MRRRGPIRVVLVFGVIAVILAVLSALGPKARATQPARTPCGSSVTWSTGLSQRTPDGLGAAIAAAYEQVEPVTHVTAQQGTAATDTVRFDSIDWGVGDKRAPGDSTTTALDGRQIIVHAHLPADWATPTGMQAAVLTDVLHDLGLASPTSTGGVLSDADRAALGDVCAAQAAAAAAAPTTAAAGTSAASPAHVSRPENPTATTTAAAPPAAVKVLGLVLLGVIGAALAVAWLPLGPVTARVRALVSLHHRGGRDAGGAS